VLLKNAEIAESIRNSKYIGEWFSLTDSLKSSTADEFWKSACADVIRKGNYAKV